MTESTGRSVPSAHELARTAELRSFRFFPYPTPRMATPHTHNDIELNFVAEGQLTYLFGAQHVTFVAGNLCVFWAAIPHQIIQLGGTTSHYAIHLPLANFLQWGLPQPFTQQILSGIPVASSTVDDASFSQAMFERWHRHAQLNLPEYHQITMLEIEASLRLLALSARALSAEESRAVTRAGGAEIEHMVSCITTRFQEPLTVAQIASTANLHPNYAMQLFRTYTGRTIVNYLNQYRIAHAQQLLLTTDKSVLDIAFESGFNSLSRFYAVFRKTCRLSPARYRQTVGVRREA
jgi:AraC-like DNA-binding protein